MPGLDLSPASGHSLPPNNNIWESNKVPTTPPLWDYDTLFEQDANLSNSDYGQENEIKNRKKSIFSSASKLFAKTRNTSGPKESFTEEEDEYYQEHFLDLIEKSKVGYYADDESDDEVREVAFNPRITKSSRARGDRMTNNVEDPAMKKPSLLAKFKEMADKMPKMKIQLPENIRKPSFTRRTSKNKSSAAAGVDRKFMDKISNHASRSSYRSVIGKSSRDSDLLRSIDPAKIGYDRVLEWLESHADRDNVSLLDLLNERKEMKMEQEQEDFERRQALSQNELMEACFPPDPDNVLDSPIFSPPLPKLPKRKSAARRSPKQNANLADLELVAPTGPELVKYKRLQIHKHSRRFIVEEMIRDGIHPMCMFGSNYNKEEENEEENPWVKRFSKRNGSFYFHNKKTGEELEEEELDEDVEEYLQSFLK